MKTPEQAAEEMIAQVRRTAVNYKDGCNQIAALIRQRDREVYEAGQIAMRNRAAEIADDFWGVDTAAGRIRAITPEKML